MKKEGYRRKTTFEKKKQVLSGFTRVDHVLPGCCTGQSFNKPELVQPSGLGLV
jgi:hypothetical protein